MGRNCYHNHIVNFEFTAIQNSLFDIRTLHIKSLCRNRLFLPFFVLDNFGVTYKFFDRLWTVSGVFQPLRCVYFCRNKLKVYAAILNAYIMSFFFLKLGRRGGVGWVSTPPPCPSVPTLISGTCIIPVTFG